MSEQRILVIDDEEHMTFIVKAMLEYRYDVATTTSSLSALKYLCKNSVDLVLLDIKMPCMDGIEALKEIKSRHPETVVVMLTAYASAENIQKATALGAYGFIIKPFDIKELRFYVDRVLSRSVKEQLR